jgi:predicted dehydrogenase
MAPSPIRIGIVGAGANTKAKHIPLLQAIPGVEILQVCNRSEESSRNAADEFGIPRTANRWEDLVANPDLDAVVIGTWPYLHAPITLAALAAGKHVLCEARMAMNAEEARRMLDASRARPELISMIVPSPFTLHWDKTLRRLLKENAIGRLLHVDVFANSGAFFQPDRPMTWRDDRTLSGLNTQMLGIYYEAMARWTGHVKLPVQASARIHARQRTDATGRLQTIHIPDHLDILGEFESGATLHMRCSQITGACPTPNDFILYGSDATLRLDLTRCELTMTRPKAQPEIIHVPDEEKGSWRVEEEFINAIRGIEPVTHTPFTEGLRYMEFTDAVAQAGGYA